ncbi:Txe/YoeB family addiction module toxin [Selenomonas sp. oral taxon 138]|uniref:Txe/YoeB family addiction module toxin n=1 Tax=Selenomonas sp. oral taxon 138 TaxID=712532 RepID=UPI0002A2A3E4|nr:Txe/YoeB family addiction module toxin [Selenomonas sp. oral taxon 138]EKX98121.1 addiction module toxin, Txe/YoeB family [Selenomonas sp. oral taxon 138 str. F0429]
MNKVFSENAWRDFMEWVQEDRKVARKIHELLTDIERNGHDGLGKPEQLRHVLAGYWSRRITQKDRLIYTFDEKNIYIAACKGHYE